MNDTRVTMTAVTPSVATEPASPRSRVCGRVVAQDDVVNARLDRLAHLGHHRQRRHVLLDLLHPGRPRDDCADVRVGHAPGERQLRQRAAQLLRDGLQRVRLLQLVALLHQLLLRQALVQLNRQPRAGRYAAPAVLAGEHARGQRAPGGQAQAAGSAVQGQELLLHLFPVEQVVLGLLHLGRHAPQLARNGHRLCNHGRGPLRGAPVERVPVVHQPAHRPHGLLQRCVGVWPMAEHHVHVVHLQPLE
mmetsp:Transcript_37628/g.95044  ORF Transcript_37628/g.95044 Transcript_37628/m.95044 type:complete len:247 (-) Transcript_37628:346-1086(-)